MTPFDDFIYLLNAVLLGEEPTIEDFILLVGTIVAFVAFILWCCFPISPKETGNPSRDDSRGFNNCKKLTNSYNYENLRNLKKESQNTNTHHIALRL